MKFSSDESKVIKISDALNYVKHFSIVKVTNGPSDAEDVSKRFAVQELRELQQNGETEISCKVCTSTETIVVHLP